MKTHTHIATAASETEGVAAVSCMESHMNRRPLGSIDPNSIRETELHTECRRGRERESLYSPQHDRERDTARQRAAATRTRETDEARAERCVCDCPRCEQPYALTWCSGEMSASNAMLLKKKKHEIIHRKTEQLCHHRPRSKAHSNEYENNIHKA